MQKYIFYHRFEVFTLPRRKYHYMYFPSAQAQHKKQYMDPESVAHNPKRVALYPENMASGSQKTITKNGKQKP